ncbi:hypothetical protein BDU57DRAFT_514422 [Ampelomyces quisqualis]|uniref:Uncharacterized protein n=1 Tax=Ampelomyces quisqualis TaxID=50730 RepID=A0A6A5QRB3_AMPQU|nr:hypothetical protein BDU57DRAFT_514422 [Ampelomyces quisqualis]
MLGGTASTLAPALCSSARQRPVQAHYVLSFVFIFLYTVAKLAPLSQPACHALAHIRCLAPTQSLQRARPYSNPSRASSISNDPVVCVPINLTQI